MTLSEDICFAEISSNKENYKEISVQEWSSKESSRQLLWYVQMAHPPVVKTSFSGVRDGCCKKPIGYNPHRYMLLRGIEILEENYLA